MTENTGDAVTRLHNKLANIYRLGRLTDQEKLAARGLWARIERLESAEVAQAVKESNYTPTEGAR